MSGAGHILGNVSFGPAQPLSVSVEGAFCPSCGVAWAEHLGIAGTCEALRRAVAERDEARLQYRSTLALAEALAKTQIELKAERDEARKIADSAMLEADKLRPRQGACIYEISESVRDKYDPQHEGEGMDNE